MMAVTDEDIGEGPMRLRTYYTCAILAPLAVLATVAAAGGDSGSLTLGVGPGGTVRWLYPRSAVRDLLAASVVCSWVLWELYRRPWAKFQEALWRAPVCMVVLLTLGPTAVVLVNGLARRMLSEQGGLIALRVLVRIIMGFGYVGLVEWVCQQLQIRKVLPGEVAD
jgi:hypothetical protein